MERKKLKMQKREKKKWLSKALKRKDEIQSLNGGIDLFLGAETYLLEQERK